MNTQIYEFGPYRLNLKEHHLSCQGRDIPLRPRLFALLTVLVERSGQMLEKEELLQMVWQDVEVEEKNIAVSINELRRKLGEEYIETVSRHGYRFIAPVKIVSPEIEPFTTQTEGELEPPGGAVPLHSRFYIERKVDGEFREAIMRGDSIVLVKGARQVGKTSLLARGLQRAREAGCAVVQVDLQRLTADALASVDKLLFTLADLIAFKLKLKTAPHQVWVDFLSPSVNFERYLEGEVLEKLTAPLVLGLDEIDRLFGRDYASGVFGLFRSWHNMRALDPSGQWRKLRLALAYATEAHLFITDLNQSPFNVGTRLTLGDFTLEQIAELNRRYGSPLKDETELARYFELLGGHPYLVQRGLYEMAKRSVDLTEIVAKADQDEWIFGDNLRRMLVSLEQDEGLREAMHGLLQGKPGLSANSFYRLRTSGVLVGDSAQDARPRCLLYADFLRRHLH